VVATILGHPDHRSNTHEYFFWGGFVKDKVYIPPMPVDLLELRNRIVNAIALVDVSVFNRLRDELEYLNVCNILRGSHIGHVKKL
jgi:hypothetical protein